MTRPPDREAVARAVRDFVVALGHELEGELSGTPERVADAWLGELLEGDTKDAAAILRAGRLPLGAAHRPALVCLRGVRVTLVCPHHLLPSRGTATIAFVPGEGTCGLGTLAQAIHAETRRLVLQETAGERLARVVVDALGAKAAACRLELVHGCLADRGERELGAIVETVSFAGSDPGAELVAAMLGSPPGKDPPGP